MTSSQASQKLNKLIRSYLIMYKFEWSEELATNVPKIDEQHKYFISLINKAEDLVETNAMKEEVDEIINELDLYGRKHFDTEEKFLDEINYPKKSEHSILHIHIDKQLKIYYQSILFKGAKPNELLDFLSKWFESHLRNDDKQWADFYRKQKSESK
jgi:hemerythrin